MASYNRSDFLQVLKDQDTTAGLASIIKHGTRIVVSAGQVVQPVTQGLAKSIFTVAAPEPGTGQVGLLVSAEIMMSMERVLTLVLTHDGQAVIGETKAVSGEKKPASMWFPFSQGLTVTVGNPSTYFAVVFHIFAILYYLPRTTYETIYRETLQVFNEAENAVTAGIE